MKTPIRIAEAVAAASVAVMVAAGPASAHTSLQSASPAIGSTIGPPGQIVLTFADSVRFTQILLMDGAGRRYESGKPFAVDNKVTEKVNPVPNGTYTVAWRVVAPDGHPVEGTYHFTVIGSSATAAPARANVTKPVKADNGADSSSGMWWIILIGLGVVGACAAAFAFRRRTSE